MRSRYSVKALLVLMALLVSANGLPGFTQQQSQDVSQALDWIAQMPPDGEEGYGGPGQGSGGPMEGGHGPFGGRFRPGGRMGQFGPEGGPFQGGPNGQGPMGRGPMGGEQHRPPHGERFGGPPDGQFPPGEGKDRPGGPRPSMDHGPGGQGERHVSGPGGNHPPMGPGGRPGGGIIAALNLSPDQRERLKNLMQASRNQNQGAQQAVRAKRQQLMEMLRSGSGSKERALALHREIAKAQSDLMAQRITQLYEMKAILKPEQFSKLRSMMQKRQSMGPGGFGKQGRPGGR